MKVEFPFVGPAYSARSPNYSAQRLVNLYWEPGQGKRPGYLVGTPGLTLSSFGSPPGPIRGMKAISSTRLIYVASERVYLFDETGAQIGSFGTVANDSLPVSIAYDGTNILIASAGVLYGMTESTFTSPTVLRSDVSSVDFIDGYFVLSLTDTGRFMSSGQYTQTIDALDFATAEASPDNIVRLLVSNREIILFGQDTSEVWYNAGTAGFPFARIQGAVIQEGLAAKDSAVVCAQTVAWLGKGGNVWSMQGYTPKLISTPAIAYAISQWPDPSDARAFFYQQEGHAFYVLSSVSGDETWAYDFSTGEWHQRALQGEDGTLKRILPEHYAFFAGRHMVGGAAEEQRTSGLLADLDLSAYRDVLNVIPRIRTCAALQRGMTRQRNKTLTIDMDRGVGLAVGVLVNGGGASLVGDDPVAMLRYSKDGGMTWSASVTSKLGRIGEYGHRVRWNRVGGGDREVYEVKITDPVKVCITGAYLG